MTKRTILPEELGVQELEQKIAPSFLNNSMFDVLGGFSDSDSFLWDHTVTRIENYLGYDYNPMGIIDGSFTPSEHTTLWDHTLTRVDNYLGYDYNPMGIIDGSTPPPEHTTLWDHTITRIDNYLGYHYDPMSIIYGNSNTSFWM